MGVNFVPHVGNFLIETGAEFGSGDHDVEDGCVDAGTHRLLRFDMLTYNAGDEDAVIGRPEDHPDLYEHSSSHGHDHLKDFNEYELYDADGDSVGVGRKQAFCLMDSGTIPDHPQGSGSPTYDCGYQGISAGWYDRYGRHLGCQYLVIDGVPDGDYTLEAVTNAQGALPEACRGDNTTWKGLRLQGDTVTEIPLPWAPEDCVGLDPENVQAENVRVGSSASWKVVDGDHWILDFGPDESAAKRSAEIIRHYGLSRLCFVGRPGCPGQDPMTYWLDEDGNAPTGSLSDEDTIGFDPDNLQVTRVGTNWKVVDGSHWLLDFGPSEGNARAARYFIRKYGFTEIAFVDRPDPGMVYFKGELALPDVPLRPPFFRDVAFDELLGAGSVLGG
jgi:hypothetical protein